VEQFRPKGSSHVSVVPRSRRRAMVGLRGNRKLSVRWMSWKCRNRGSGSSVRRARLLKGFQRSAPQFGVESKRFPREVSAGGRAWPGGPTGQLGPFSLDPGKLQAQAGANAPLERRAGGRDRPGRGEARQATPRARPRRRCPLPISPSTAKSSRAVTNAVRTAFSVGSKPEKFLWTTPMGLLKKGMPPSRPFFVRATTSREAPLWLLRSGEFRSPEAFSGIPWRAWLAKPSIAELQGRAPLSPDTPRGAGPSCGLPRTSQHGTRQHAPFLP
jgi:hypothetical protein